MVNMYITSYYSILMFHHEKRLPILDGELRHHRLPPEHIPMLHDVMAQDLG